MTPTSTDPAVAATFAIEASNYGRGVVSIARKTGLPTIEGNVLAPLESEVGVKLAPLDFARGAQHISLDEARAALLEMGIDLPARIPTKEALSATLRSIPRLTPTQVEEFLRRVKPQ